MVNRWVSSFQCFVFIRQHHCSGRDDADILAAVLAVSDGDVCLIDKQILLRTGQQEPIPVVDRIVQMVLHFIDDHLLALLQFHARSGIVSILIRHHVEQLHRTV